MGLPQLKMIHIALGALIVVNLWLKSQKQRIDSLIKWSKCGTALWQWTFMDNYTKLTTTLGWLDVGDDGREMCNVRLLHELSSFQSRREIKIF